jgi:hypothetical protein
MPTSNDVEREEPVEGDQAVGHGEQLEDLEVDPETSARVVGGTAGLNPQPFPPQFS